MPISTAAAEEWTRLITLQNVVGHIQLKTGYGVVDFVVGARAADSPQTLPLIGIVTNYTKAEIDGTLVQQSDLMVTLDSTQAVKKIDTVLIADVEYRIIDIEVINMAGTLVGYIVQVRL